MAKPWIRLYRDAILKPKVGRLSLEDRGFWATCLMLSDDDGNLPTVEDIAWTLRLSEDVVRDGYMASLIRHGLVTCLVTRDVTEHVTKYRLHDWHVHQHASDGDPTARERKQRQREREKAQKSAVTRDVTEHVTTGHANVTRTDTDTDTDTEKKKEEAREPVRDDPATGSPSRPKTSKRGTRWPSEAVVPDEWLAEGDACREMANRPRIDLRAEALKFANYWSAKSGGSATKLDWKRTWLNWCLTANGGSHGSRNHKSQLEQLADIVGAEQVIDG